MFRSIITLLSLSCLCLSAQADEITLQKIIQSVTWLKRATPSGASPALFLKTHGYGQKFGK